VTAPAPGLCTHTVVYQFDGWTPACRPAIGRKTSVPANPAIAGAASSSAPRAMMRDLRADQMLDMGGLLPVEDPTGAEPGSWIALGVSHSAVLRPM